MTPREILKNIEENGFIHVLQWRNATDYLEIYMKRWENEKERRR